MSMVAYFMAVVGHISSVTCPRLAESTWEQVCEQPYVREPLTADPPHKGLVPTVSERNL